MKSWVLERIRHIEPEDIFVAVFGASFLVGVWYALPMVNTITDTWAFSGGVLRAMEAHTLLPGGDVPYGTLSFYQNYIFMAVALIFGFVFNGFDIEALKTVLILNPSYGLLVPRIVSALTAVVLLVIVYRFLKSRVDSLWWRLALTMLAFGSVLTALLTRSGKMWMLSIALGVVSFIYLYRALTEEREQGVPGRLSFISIVTAFLATANFPFAGIFLINIPVIFFSFSRTVHSLRRLFLMVLGSSALFLGIVALNAQNTIQLIWPSLTQLTHPIAEHTLSAEGRLTFWSAFLVNARQAVEAFPLLILALIPALRTRCRDKTLALLALLYGVVYIIAASILFRTDQGLALNVRHIFPLGFFLMFLIVAYGSPARRIAIAFFSVGTLIYLYTMVLLSVPATYNDASNFIVSYYGDKEIRIDENIFELTLPMNRASYTLFADEHCGSTCQYRQALDTDIAFRPLVVTDEVNHVLLGTLPPPTIAVVEHAVEGCAPIARFGNTIPDDQIFDIDINLGRMLMPSFYMLHRLGKNIYLYDAVSCQSLKAGLF